MEKEFKISDENPFYILGSDNPNVSLVTRLLNDSNYQTWSIEFKRTFSTKNKVGFIDGTHTKPRTKKDNYTIPWEKCNDLVIA